LGFPFYTRNWQDVNQSLFKALKLERIAIGIFLAFIILVAALDIISTLTMVVMEKNRDIAILKAMGASRKSILNIFLTEGMIIGVVGTTIGTILGYLICYLLKTSDFIKSLIPFDPQVYYVSEFPVRIEPIYFLGVALTSLIICLIATLYPSFQASRKDPVEALRYE
jgi:lipoprotein-releasing system permease protein